MVPRARDKSLQPRKANLSPHVVITVKSMASRRLYRCTSWYNVLVVHLLDCIFHSWSQHALENRSRRELLSGGHAEMGSKKCSAPRGSKHPETM